MSSKLPRDLIAVGSITLTYVVTQVYVFEYPNYDITTFVVGAALPFLVAVALPMFARNRILLYASLAFYWALVDDGPVFLDSVFTWPEVTRFHPAAPHLFLEVLYHLLTAVFLFLAIRKAMAGGQTNARKIVAISFLAVVTFVLAYLQNVPFGLVQDVVEHQWYQLDVTEHLLSVFVFYLTVRFALSREVT